MGTVVVFVFGISAYIDSIKLEAISGIASFHILRSGMMPWYSGDAPE